MTPIAKSAWQISAEIRLKRLESEANQSREVGQAIYAELTDLSQQKNRLQERREVLARAPRRGGPESDPNAVARQIDGQLASVDAELEALAAAIADCNNRRAAAQESSTVKVSAYERAKRALHATAGGLPFAAMGV